MKHFKLMVVLALLVFIGIFFLGNFAAFDTLVTFKLNLYFLDAQWEHRVYTLMAIAMGLGFLIGVLAMGKSYLKIRETLKQERKTKLQASSTSDSPQSTHFQGISSDISVSTTQTPQKKGDVALSP